MRCRQEVLSILYRRDTSNAVKLVATVKLLVSTAERERLLATLRKVNEACSWLAERAFEAKSADKVGLQRLYYREIRERFGLSAQHAVRSISKVCETYRRDKSKLCTFKPLGAIAYDQRIYTFKNGLDRVSILAIDGRMIVPCAVGAYHRARLDGARGQADLVYRGGKFYLFVTVDVPNGSPVEVKDWLGVDLGIRNIAVDSDGECHSGNQMLALRSRIVLLRTKLQSAGTKSAKRHLRQLRGKEKRFHAYTNHVISKLIVRKAVGTERGIAIEDLSGIRDRVTVCKALRTALHGWSFSQLRAFLCYKSAIFGVSIVAVDPRNTSQTCPECSNVDKANRRSQASFVCTGCGFAAHADVVGARNIASRARVNVPIGSAARLSINKY
jgi:putative transposase